MTALALVPERVIPEVRVRRITSPGSRDDRLFFAQVREDPRVEIMALAPRASDRVVVVSSGGCTALSLLAAGAGEVHAVDVNCTQNHLVELKVAAVSLLHRFDAIRFLGALPTGPADRLATYIALRHELGSGARSYWDGQTDAIERGVLRAGVSERFIALVAWVINRLVQRPERVRRMLACRSVSEQRELFAREWDGPRWRWLFHVLLNRWSMSRAYDPAFFAHAGLTSFAEHFRRLAEHTLCDIPAADNYFLHEMLTGRYPVEQPHGVPPYLSSVGARAVGDRRGALLLVDGGFTDHLRTLATGTVNCFALSNICEWMSPEEIRALFREVERVAAPGARVVVRNFVGHTTVPTSRSWLIEDKELGAALTRTDRSAVQARVVVCRVGRAS